MKYVPFLVLSPHLMSCQSNWKNEVIADTTVLEQRMEETKLAGNYMAQLELFSDSDSIIFYSWDLETPVSRLTEK